MRDYLEIGPTPPEETCIPMNTDSVAERAECKRYIECIRAKLGPEPEGAQLRVRSNNHDFGTYYEVACFYDNENEEATDYALLCEGHGPATWDDTAPLVKGEDGRILIA